MGIMENNMETAIVYRVFNVGMRVCGLGFRV